MSFEDQFYLPNPVSTYAPDDVEARVRAMLPQRVHVSVRQRPGLLSVTVGFTGAEVDAVAEKLGSSKDRWLAYAWRDDLDEQDEYEIVVEFAEMEHHELRVSSSDGDNRAAWPLAFALCGCVAEAYGATEEPPPKLSELN